MGAKDWPALTEPYLGAPRRAIRDPTLSARALALLVSLWNRIEEDAFRDGTMPRPRWVGTTAELAALARATWKTTKAPSGPLRELEGSGYIAAWEVASTGRVGRIEVLLGSWNREADLSPQAGRNFQSDRKEPPDQLGKNFRARSAKSLSARSLPLPLETAETSEETERGDRQTLGRATGAASEDGATDDHASGVAARVGPVSPSGYWDGEAFDTFWDAYPRKEKKQLARETWQSLCPKPATPSAMLQKLHLILQLLEVRRVVRWELIEERYIPQASKFLSTESFDPDYVAEQVAAAEAAAPYEGLSPRGRRTAAAFERWLRDEQEQDQAPSVAAEYVVLDDRADGDDSHSNECRAECPEGTTVTVESAAEDTPCGESRGDRSERPGVFRPSADELVRRKAAISEFAAKIREAHFAGGDRES